MYDTYIQVLVTTLDVMGPLVARIQLFLMSCKARMIRWNSASRSSYPQIECHCRMGKRRQKQDLPKVYLCLVARSASISPIHVFDLYACIPLVEA